MSISLDIKKKLGDFSLEISFETDAKRIGILGPSGCGKSMTLKSIAGIEKPDSGRIQIDDRVLFDQGEKINLKPQKRNVGYMFQNYALFPTMTVVQNIGAGLGISDEDRNARVTDMIERFHLQGLEKHLPGQLSGGQQQRVALARIMAYRPDLILLDEPFSALDEHLKERLQHEMMTMLEGLDVKPIEAVGKEFDPNFHNAVMHVEDDTLGENIVAEELQKGYLYRDSVVRHSMVKVAN